MKFYLLFIVLFFSHLTKAALPPTSAKGSGDATFATTFKFDFGAFPLTRSGTNITFGLLPLSTGTSGTLDVARGGTGQTSFTSGYLRSNGTVLSSSATVASSDISGVIATANGGTNTATAPTINGVVYHNGTNYTATAAGSANQLLRATGGAPAYTTATYPSTTTINQILYSDGTNSVAGLATTSVGALVTNGGAPSFTSGSTANRVLRTTGGTISFAQLAAATDISGQVPLGNGGTGASLDPTAGSVIVTNGSTLGITGQGTAGQHIRSYGTSSAAWAWPYIDNFSTAKTGNYTLVASTDYLVSADATSAAFTLTLPTAVGISGKIFILKRVDQTLANQITIATTSSQTIDGATTQILATQYEQYMVMSTGANWLILSHTYSGARTSYTPTITGMGTITSEGTYWRRGEGGIYVESTFVTGTVTAAAFSISLPSGITINATNMATSTDTNSHGLMYTINGNASTYASSGSSGGPYPIFSDTAVSSTLLYAAAASSGTRFAKTLGSALSAGSIRHRITFGPVPITGWRE